MSIGAKTTFRFASAALFAALLTSTASAQRYVTFGDSLSDNGNLFALSGGASPPPPYFAGRFSNGPVWIESIAGPQAGWTGGLTPAGSLNFAFGGSRSDAIMTPGPGTVTQIGAFFGGGGTFAATDIATIWAGANDIFQAIAIPANQNTAAMGAVATTAATNVATQVGTLAAAGARTIVVLNLPDLGGAPNFNAGPAAPLAGYTSGVYNATLQAGLAGVVATNPNTRILQVNVAGLFAAVQANPSAFGFANATNSCIATPACVGGTTATQNSYVFWDGVHPTAAGHAVIASTVTQYLTAQDRALAAASITEVGLANRRSGAYRALERMGDFKPQAGKTDVYISIIGDQSSVGVRGVAPAYSFATGGLEFGVIRHITPQYSVGMAFSARTGEATSSGAGNKITYAPTSFTADIMARWTNGTAFIQGDLGASINRFSDFERKLNIGSLVNKGSATGSGISAVVEAGYNFGMGNITLTPSAKVGYLYAQTASFQETGLVAPLAYRARSVSTFVAAAEIKAKMALSQQLSAYALVGYEAYFGQSSGALKGRIADSPGSNFSRKTGNVESPGFTFGVGLTGGIMNVPVTAEYRGAVASDGRLQHRGTISARIGF